MYKAMSKYPLLLSVLLFVCIAQAKAQSEPLPYPTDTIRDTVVYRYPAPRRIGIYRISKTFNVPQETIIRWNPQLRDRGPQLEEILLIPAGPVTKTDTKTATVKDNPPLTNHPEDEEEETDPLLLPDPVTQTEPAVQPAPVTPTDQPVWRLAVLLPFDSRSASRDGYNDRFYDFYTGLLTAVYQAQRAGMRLEIHTYDVPRTGDRLTETLSDPWLATAHALIGPAYTNQVNKTAEWANEHHIPMLVPFTSRVKGIDSNPYLLQFNPTPDRKARCLADTIENHKDSLRCIFFNAGRKPAPEVAHLLTELKNRNISVRNVPLRTLMNDSADYAFSDSLTNLVILHTDNYANASVILPHIRQAAIRHNIRLLAQDSWVQQDETAALRPVYASFFSRPDPESNDAQTYNAIHNHYFAAGSAFTPAIAYPRFDQLGYDLTRHLLEILPALHSRDSNAGIVISKPFTKGLQSGIRFVRTGDKGGWINEHIQAEY